ncbi:MAG: hypothetical protein FWE55_03245 [Synergistaceae bacterium]|nr:hypothetical protein [Synergistaceae bacterium]
MTPPGGTEEELIPVAFPGPWWTNLTYAAPQHTRPKPWTRVRAPMGRGERVGVVMPGGAGDDFVGELRRITEIIDDVPKLTESVTDLLGWFCDAYLCGFGTAMKTLLPEGFLKGKEMPPPVPDARRRISGDVSFVYESLDPERFERYASMLSEGRTVVSFPLYPGAVKFFKYMLGSPLIPDDVKKRALLYPRVGGAAEWRIWQKLRSPEDDTMIVVGGQSSAMAPLRRISRFIVDDESNNAWRTMRHPIYNVRSLIASRARFEGASLVLGGRMPSARAFMRYEEINRQSAHNPTHYSREKKIIFVDIKLAYTPSVEGVTGGLAVSEPLVRETEAAISRSEWALWILDRKGYAGEILCEECGAPVKCVKCGGAVRIEREDTRCVSCGARAPFPDECPNCAGRLLSARRPGLEALLPLADAAVVSPAPIFGPDAPEGTIRSAVLEHPAGVILGTRAVLSMCDEIPVGMVGWIDADGEARSEEHSARQHAFSLIWESCWRGISSQNRKVLVQTRRPASDWQAGLDSGHEGWRVFWRAELRDRRELSMPPFTSLVRAEGGTSGIGRISERVSGLGFECWSSDEGKKSTLWIRTKKLSELRRVFSPYFHIGNARKGYPSVTVWHE